MNKFWVGLWSVLGVLSLASMWHYVRVGEKAEILGSLYCGVFFLALSHITRNGFFSQYRGGWLTYVGLFFALGAPGVALQQVGASFWGPRTPTSEDWVSILILFSFAALFLALGERRNRKSRLVASART